MNQNKSVGVKNRMAILMHENDLSYRELSNLTGLPKSTLQRYFTNADVKIPLHCVELISKGLNCDVSYLVGFNDSLENIDKLHNFDLLNSQGLQKVQDYINDLIKIDEFKK